jgi:S-adenosylmethionine-diacylgycerolhomoserine-N-methlytransferase
MGLIGRVWSALVWLIAEVRVLALMLFHPISGSTHKERLESFYRSQAGSYDEYRRKLLHGRPKLFGSLPNLRGAVWVDLGAGTGYNLELMAEAGKIEGYEKIYLVDLSGSLLKQAAERVKKNGWTNVEIVEADATTWTPPNGEEVDLVTFSYSLTMIPNWFAAVDHAYSLLKKGGVLGITDFYVARKYAAAEGLHENTWFQRTVWPIFFAFDNVNLSRDHLPYLQYRFKPNVVEEYLGSVPYTLLKCPYYVFVGTKQ